MYDHRHDMSEWKVTLAATGENATDRYAVSSLIMN